MVTSRGAGELAHHGLEGGGIVLAKTGAGLEVGFAFAQQPDHFQVAVALGFEPTAGAELVQVAVNVKLEQVGGRVTGPSAAPRIGLGEPEAGGAQVQPGDEGVEEAHRVVRADIVFDRHREQLGLRTIRTGDEVHGAVTDARRHAQVSAWVRAGAGSLRRAPPRLRWPPLGLLPRAIASIRLEP